MAKSRRCALFCQKMFPIAVLLGCWCIQASAYAFFFGPRAERIASVFISSPVRDTLVPVAMETTPDSGVVVVGYLAGFGRPWAAKVNAQGHLEWSYLRPDNLPDILPGKEIQGRYTAVVPMPDGSVYLCGRAKTYFGTSMNVLTQLDKKGALISELPIPDQDKLFNINACVSIDGGVMLLGGEWTDFKAVFVRDNKIVWQIHENGFPPLYFSAVDSGSTLVAASGNTVTISLTDHTSTVALTIDDMGHIRRRVTLDGGYVHIRNLPGVVQSEDFFGPTPETNSTTRQIRRVSKSGNFDVSAQGSIPSFEPVTVIRKTNGSLVYFGLSKHTFGKSIRPAVAQTLADLSDVTVIDLAGKTEGNWGAIRAAAWVYADTFAAAHSTGYPSKFGATIDFIHFK